MVIAALKVEEDPGIFHLPADFQIPLVPDQVVPARVPYAAGGVLVGERHVYRFASGKIAEPFPPPALVPIVKAEVPYAVQALP
jgi:hypothetical protein